MQKEKFDFYEIVKIVSNAKNKIFLKGTYGTVTGKAEPEIDGEQWSYAVDPYATDSGWCFNEDELEYTGKFDDPEKFKPVGSVKVVLNSKGEGSLKENDQD
jgi:hypothetical protein